MAASFGAFTRGQIVNAHVSVRISHISFEDLPKDVDGQTRLLTELRRDVDHFADYEEPRDRRNVSPIRTAA